MPPVKGNLLVADDNRDDLRLLVEILTECGHEVRQTPDGTAALATARASPPDLILLDVQMPQLDGYATCRQLKADERTSDIPVLFISAGNEIFDKVHAFNAGGVDYISKPFQPEEVVARVEVQLHIHFMQQRLERQNTLLQQEIAERVRVESELQHHQDHLEAQVDARTAELQRANLQLQQEIAERTRAEAAVQAHAEELSRTNAKLTRALRLKDEFLAMMSHELRTPLTAVLGISEGLQENLYGPISAQQQQALAQVLQSGRHLLGILSDILDLTRIDAGVTPLITEPVSIMHLCQTALQLVAEPARKKNLRLMQSVAFGVVGVRADERRLTQILVNLLDNAVKFTPAKGTVELDVEADADQECIRFIVRDTGIGIAAEDMERLFHPFTQVDGRLSRAYEGIGLGLTLVQRLTALHGGSVQVTSSPGAGSRFTVTLPWSEDDNDRPRAPTAARPKAHEAWATPPRVLVVEDHEPTLELYIAQLAHLGCTVIIARTGAEALALIRAQRPTIVLLDIQIPDLDGMGVIRQVRADASVAATPIIAVTALAMSGDRERLLAAGATRYLAKPVSNQTLMREISEVLASVHGEP
ncbi:response regulator [Oscillochloris sp. ZM17-4]|uniref:response regulator n=1 Tax=Oscillochloris sp. ZM17-4 TaxID=2866714 RepID=UPI001C72BA21|nr:response regulator [Oscillochloris sp. ZM17-4]MBX0330560.1 response regulator [Oscillochloris sp. ZM17-4]